MLITKFWNPELLQKSQLLVMHDGDRDGVVSTGRIEDIEEMQEYQTMLIHDDLVQNVNTNANSNGKGKVKGNRERVKAHSNSKNANANGVDSHHVVPAPILNYVDINGGVGKRKSRYSPE